MTLASAEAAPTTARYRTVALEPANGLPMKLEGAGEGYTGEVKLE